MKPCILVLAAATLAAVSAAAAQANASAPPQDGVCTFSGWSTDPDPAGLNVRAAPSGSARIVGTLPPPRRTEEYDIPLATEFDVVEARNGWFRIRNAYRWGEERGRPSSLPSGWISGRHLGFALQTDRAFAAPDPSSPVVATHWRDREGEARAFAFRNPSACRGEWVRLMVADHDGGEREAWVRGVCGMQETTCDGVRGDLIEADELPVH